jgi:putative transcriptional regulator
VRAARACGICHIDYSEKTATVTRHAIETSMAIIINIDVMLAKRKMSVTELSDRVGITMANISVLKNGKAKAIRLSTLEAICKALECQPGDILEYRNGRC